MGGANRLARPVPWDRDWRSEWEREKVWEHGFSLGVVAVEIEQIRTFEGKQTTVRLLRRLKSNRWALALWN